MSQLQQSASLLESASASNYYEVHGQGEPIIFIHGVGLERSVWKPQIDHFSSTNLVVSYDLLGHGKANVGHGKPSLDEYVKQLQILMDDLALKSAALVGHSMGGAIAMRFAYRYTDRVDALAVLNAVYCRSQQAREPVLQRAELLDQGQGKLLVNQTLDRWFSKSESNAMPQARDDLKGMLDAVDPVAYARAYRVFAESDGLHVGELEKITSKALFMTGELDPNSTPLMSSQMAEHVANGEVKVLDGARHMMPYVNFKRVNAALTNFLFKK